MDFELPGWIVQFGIAGLVVVIGYRIAMKLIDKWSVAESQRTEAISTGFKAITDSHERVLDTMHAHQQAEIGVLNELGKSQAALITKINTVFDLTPAPLTVFDPPAKVIVSKEIEQEEETPVDVPKPRPTPPPRAASSPGAWGPIVPKKS